MKSITDTYDTLEAEYLNITTKYLNVSEDTVESALLQHTAVYAFFGAVLAYAKKKVDTESLMVEHMEAQSRESRRTALTSQGLKVTDRALDGWVKTQDNLNSLRSSLLEAQHKYNLSRNIVSSLDHQKDMLVQLSANKRAEQKMNSDLG